jgi:hypothetical protein
MRRLVPLVSLALAPGLVLASCGGSSPSVRSAPPSTAGARPQSKLHLAAETESVGRASAVPALYPVRPTEYVLDAPLAQLAATATVRRLVPHEVHESDVRALATALGLDAGAVVRTNDGFSVSGPDASLTVSLAGGNAYVNYGFGAPGAVGGSSGSAGAGAPTIAMLPTTTTTKPPDVPDEGAVARIARALLDRMRVLGTEQWAVDGTDSGGVAVACPVGVPCPISPPVVYQRTATFRRVVDGAPLQGADWSVTVGAHGRVESVSGTWATAEFEGTYPLRSTDDVFADLRAGRTHPVGPQPMTALGVPEDARGPSSTIPALIVHVSGVSLGYAPWDAFDGRQMHVDVVPTYRFHASADGGATHYDIEVLALDPAAFDIGSPTPPIPKGPSEPAPEPAPAPLPAPLPAPAPTR